MKALVIGGTGFIGSHLVDGLIEKGDDVTVLSLTHNKHIYTNPNAYYISGDYRNTDILIKVLHDIDIVYHLASSTTPATADNYPAKDIQDNLIGTVNLVETMLRHDMNRIVYFSSGGTVYGNPESVPVLESSSRFPISSYGIVKNAIENYLQMYSCKGLKPLILRPSNPYGPGQNPKNMQGLISTIFYKLMTNEIITIWGDGNTIRDYIYIEDLIELAVQAGHSDYIDVYNAGSGKGYSINEIVEYANKITKISPIIEYKPKRPFDVQEIILNTNKAQQDFEWVPSTGIMNGMQQHWEWILNNHSKINF